MVYPSQTKITRAALGLLGTFFMSTIVTDISNYTNITNCTTITHIYCVKNASINCRTSFCFEYIKKSKQTIRITKYMEIFSTSLLLKQTWAKLGSAQTLEILFSVEDKKRLYCILTQKFRQYCWISGFCLMMELHQEGSAINRTTCIVSTNTTIIMVATVTTFTTITTVMSPTGYFYGKFSSTVLLLTLVNCW